MADDTAAVIDAPASGVEEQPVPDIQPEILDAPELPESTETDAPEIVETPTPRSIDDLSDDELVEHERIKSVLARREESARRRSEAETTRKLTQQAEQVAGVQNLAGSLKATLDAVVKHVSDGNELDPTYAQQVANYITQNAWTYHAKAATDFFNAALAAKMPEEYKFSKQELETLRELHDDVATRRKDARELYEFRLDLFEKAAVAKHEPELRKKWEAERAKAEQSKAKTDSMIQSEATRSGQPRPTTGGQGAHPSDPRSILDSATPGSPAYVEAFRKEYGFDPPR